MHTHAHQAQDADCEESDDEHDSDADEEDEEESNEDSESDDEDNEDSEDDEDDEDNGDEDDELADDNFDDGMQDDAGEDEERCDVPDDLPEAVYELLARLKKKVITLRNKLNGSKHRSDYNQLRKLIGPLTQKQWRKIEERRIQRATKFFSDELQKRSFCRPEIVSRLALMLNVEERERMRGLGFLRQEWFLAMRECVRRLQTRLYTAENTMEIRLSELISIRSLRRMRRVLTTVRDDAGKWVHFAVASPPVPGRKGGDPSLQKKNNEAQKIFRNRHVYAPQVIATDDAVRAASRKLLAGRKMEVAVPSKDGLSGAAWNLLDVARDVFAGLSAGVNNLRALFSAPQPEADPEPSPSKRARKRARQNANRAAAADPSRAHASTQHIGRLRRLWLGFDGLTWTKRNGLVRWCLRCCDTVGKHNDKRFAREGLTYVGADKNEGLVLSSKIGGENSIRAITDAGVICTKTDGAHLPDAVREDDSPAGRAMFEALCFECEIHLDIGPEGEEQKSQLVSGGDRASGHAACGLGSCIDKNGVCMRCLLRKYAWTVKEACESAIRRTAVLNSLLCHVDPRPRMKAFEGIAPLKCPGCTMDVTPELMERQKEILAALPLEKQDEWIRNHLKKHYGNVPFEEQVLFMDPKWRGSSSLHRRTNMAHNNLLATFMTVTFNSHMRVMANEALDDAGMLFRFPTTSAKARCPKLGNGADARILHSNPALLVRLCEIFYANEIAGDEVVASLLAELKQEAAAAAKLVGPSKKSAPRRRPAAAPAAHAPKPKKPSKPKKPKKPKKPAANMPEVQAAAPLQAPPAPPATPLPAPASPPAPVPPSVETAAKALGAVVDRFMSGELVPASVIQELVKLTHANMKMHASAEALSRTQDDLRHRSTRLIIIWSKGQHRSLLGFAAYRTNCREGGKPTAFLYELQLAESARGKKPSVAKALIKEVEQRASLSASGRLLLSVHVTNALALGFYEGGCGFSKVGETEERFADGKIVRCLTLQKVCLTPQEEYEQEEPAPSPDEALDESEENEELRRCDDEKVGNAATALKVWLSSIKFWNAISKKVPGPQGDYDQEQLHAYAQNGQELGRQWALAIQKHTDNRANWQYVHDTFAHFYEDVMQHGHPESYDDAILESGNCRAKKGKRILFWGGTDEPDANYEQERATGKVDAEGNPIMKLVRRKANCSISAQHLENTYLAQHFEQRRGVTGKTVKELQTEHVKSEKFRLQCEGVAQSLGRLDVVMLSATE